MVKKTRPALINKLDFPLLPLLVLATAFVMLLLTLSPYFRQNYSNIACGGFVGKLCPLGFHCQTVNNYPSAGGTCVRN